MILLPKSVRVYVATEPTNLRKSFEGLSNEVRTVLAADPISGQVFLFLNRRRTQVKLLLWTRGGCTVVHKRLERGRFTFPARVTPGTACVEIDAHELAMLLEGLVASRTRAAARWSPALTAPPNGAHPSSPTIGAARVEIGTRALGRRHGDALLGARVSDVASETATGTKELRGSVLDVLRDLLGDQPATPAVLEVVAKLVARNQELELLLAKPRTSKHPNERVAREQLDLFLDELRAASTAALAEANAKLEKTAKENEGRPDPAKPPKQPPVRRPPPAGLRRVDNPIPVPPSERPCPVRGKERVCIAHDKTEVIDFKPAEAFLRVDIKEILGCDDCDVELVRAPDGRQGRCGRRVRVDARREADRRQVRGRDAAVSPGPGARAARALDAQLVDVRPDHVGHRSASPDLAPPPRGRDRRDRDARRWHEPARARSRQPQGHRDRLALGQRRG